MAFQPMRTNKREITDPAELEKILSANIVVRIAFYDEDEGYPYIVPIDYGHEYDQATGKLVLYVHCAKEGRKINLLRKNNRVCFEIDENWGLKETEAACQWGMNYNSIIGEGRIYEIPDDDIEAKTHGLDVIMKSHGRHDNLVYDPATLKRTNVLKLEAERFTGKRYRDRTTTEEVPKPPQR